MAMFQYYSSISRIDITQFSRLNSNFIFLTYCITDPRGVHIPRDLINDFPPHSSTFSMALIPILSLPIFRVVCVGVSYLSRDFHNAIILFASFSLFANGKFGEKKLLKRLIDTIPANVTVLNIHMR